MTFLTRYKNGFIQYFKYCIIGISCAVIDLGVLNILLYFFPTKQIPLLTLFNSTAYGFAVLNSYVWNTKYTFKVKKTTKKFIAFIIQAIVSLFIANLVFIFGLDLLGNTQIPLWLKTNIAKSISMFLSSLASFIFNKFFVFRKEKQLGIIE
jgi:putative flippase GtrA